jgi:hypothetical protein
VVGELTIEVANLEAHIALDARLANILKLTAGADVNIDQVKIQLKDVQATRHSRRPPGQCARHHRAHPADAGQ